MNIKTHVVKSALISWHSVHLHDPKSGHNAQVDKSCSIPALVCWRLSQQCCLRFGSCGMWQCFFLKRRLQLCFYNLIQQLQKYMTKNSSCDRINLWYTVSVVWVVPIMSNLDLCKPRHYIPYECRKPLPQPANVQYLRSYPLDSEVRVKNSDKNTLV
jgi:hypothetical protein